MKSFPLTKQAVRLVLLLLAVSIPLRAQEVKDMVLKHSDVVFMYAAGDEAYKAYQATFVGWGLLQPASPQYLCEILRSGFRATASAAKKGPARAWKRRAKEVAERRYRP